MYDYNAEVIRVIDADTLVCVVDLGFKIHHEITLRVKDLWAPERFTPEGKAAKSFVEELIASRNYWVQVVTERIPGKSFDRYIAHVFLSGTGEDEWESFASIVIGAGHGTRERP
jgi:endonuclease YncB( thermonuclease family)